MRTGGSRAEACVETYLKTFLVAADARAVADNVIPPGRPGFCVDCGASLDAGDQALWSRDGGGVCRHECPARTAEAVGADPDTPTGREAPPLAFVTTERAESEASSQTQAAEAITSAELTAGQHARDATEAARDSRQVAEALQRVKGDRTTPQQKGHVFEVKDRDQHNAHDRLRNRGRDQRVLNKNPNFKTIDARDGGGTGRAVQHKKANMHADSADPDVRRGARRTNEAVQRYALRKLDEAGEADGVVITTKGDRAADTARVEESRVSRDGLDESVDNYRRAAYGVSPGEVGKAAIKGGATAAVISAAVGAAVQVPGVIKGDIDPKDAAVNVGKAAGIGAVAGAVGKGAGVVANAMVGVAPAASKVLASGGIVAGAAAVAASSVAHGFAVARGYEGLHEAAAEIGKDGLFVGVGGVAAVGVGIALAPFELPVLAAGGAIVGVSAGVSWVARRAWHFGAPHPYNRRTGIPRRPGQAARSGPPRGSTAEATERRIGGGRATEPPLQSVRCPCSPDPFSQP